MSAADAEFPAGPSGLLVWLLVSRVELSEGARVALLVPGSHAYLDAVMSLLARGIFPIPLDPRLTPYERDRILAQLSPDLVVDDERSLVDLTEGTLGPPRAARCTSPAAPPGRRRGSTAAC